MPDELYTQAAKKLGLNGLDFTIDDISKLAALYRTNNIVNPLLPSLAPTNTSPTITTSNLDFVKGPNLRQKSNLAFKDSFKDFNSTLNSSLGILGSLSTIGSSFADNAKVADTSLWENSINEANSYDINANSYTDLIDQQQGLPSLNRVSGDQLNGKVGTKLFNTGKATLSGIKTGAQVGGPIGAIVGGVVGLGSGIAGWIAGDTKAYNKARELNKQMVIAENQNNLKVSTQANNIGKQNTFNMLANYSALGGPLTTQGSMWDTGMTSFDKGGSHESNPMGGIPVGVDQNGTPNLVEEGEVRYNDYIFSKRLTADKKLLKKYNVPSHDNKKSFADVAKKLSKEISETPNDPISKRGFEDSMSKLQMAQEEVRMKKNNKSSNKFDIGGLMEDGQWLRFTPAFGSGLSAISDIAGFTNKADYTNADLLDKAINNIRPISAAPVYDYLTYKPIDRNYILNNLNSQVGASRRAIINQANGNRAARTAALLALDNTLLSSYGDAAIKADEANYNRLLQTKQYNNAINKYNSELGLRAAITNQEMNKYKVSGRAQQAALRDRADMMSSQARSSNLNTFLTNMGNIGRELGMRKMIDNNPFLLYNSEGLFKTLLGGR